MGQIFRQAEQYLGQLSPGRFIEIGTSRNGDDGSTVTLAQWAKQYSPSGWLTTVDADPANCEFVRNMALDQVEVVNKTGEDYLRNDFPFHTDLISFLYLDNFDWDWHPDRTEDFVREQQERYTELGMDMTNVNSQQAHLLQAIEAVRGLADCSLVVCDDTWYNPWWGQYSGKSGAVVPFLLAHGFKVLYTEEEPVYGTILGRGINCS